MPVSPNIPHQPSEHACEPIAIIGMGCRFPGNNDTSQAFWQFLLAGENAIIDIPSDRWDIRQYYHPDASRPGKMYNRRGGFLSQTQVERFDAAFFGISPNEAASMGPEQRLLLEVCWEALEDAGLVPRHLAGSHTGVFIGICGSDYGAMRAQDLGTINAYTNAGRALSIASNRISYVLDLHGPSLSIDTACSSSLVALHLACESLHRDECSLALVGGANMLFDPGWSVGFCKASMLSASGQCRAFDAEADGYVRGEGIGVVVIKPLSQALKDGDPIYALIRATATNQDGRTPGLHQPDQSAQEALLREVYTRADVLPSQLVYVEAHGTGTTVGDFVEGHALGNVLGRQRSAGEWLRIGSVKTQIGHLEGASGMASLIKAALMLKHRHIPASLHFHTPNPQIPFDDLHLKVQQAREPLPEDVEAPVVGINNFGFGGTNAHIVLQAYASTRQRQPAQLSSRHPTAWLLPLSARHQEALHALAQSYLEAVSAHPEYPLQDLCFTASLRREHHAYRLGLVTHSYADLKEKLEVFLAQQPATTVVSGQAPSGSQNPPLAFVFSGNGPQWWAMGRQLLAEHPVFRAAIEACDQLLLPATGWSLLEELRADEAHSRMHQTDVAQPALFAVQIALTRLWQSWGIKPQAVVGHSVGEIAAACVAGILSLEEALRVVFHRSRLQELTAGAGKMLAVDISASEALELISGCQDWVSLASINAPTSVTLSGDERALKQIADTLEKQAIFCRFLPLNYAFHNACLDPIREDLLASLLDLQVQQGTIPFISSVTGQELDGLACHAAYWWDNVRRPVCFADAVQHLLDRGYTTFLEIGPHPVLAHYLAECLSSQGLQGTIVPSLRRQEAELATLLSSLGRLYTLGYPISWQTLVAGGRHVSLPHYPWQHERYWLEPRASHLSLPGTYRHPLLGSRLDTHSPLWENALDLQTFPYLADHRIDDTVVFPAVGYVEMALAAASEIFEAEPCRVEQLEIHRPLILDDSTDSTMQFVLSLEDSTFQITLRPREAGAAWITYATGRIGYIPSPGAVPPVDLAQIRQGCPRELSADTLYQEARRRWHFDYGPSFRRVEHIYVGGQEALGVICWQEPASEYHIHPTFLDSCLQVILAILPSPTHLPVGIETLRFYGKPLAQAHLYSYVRLVKRGPGFALCDVTVLDEAGQPVLEIQGLRLRVMSFAQDQQNDRPQNLLYEEQWCLSPQHATSQEIPALSSFAQLQAHLQPTLAPLLRELSQAPFVRQSPLLDEICLAYLLRAFQELGWTFQPGQRLSVGQLVGHLGVLALYEPLLTSWCQILARKGILKAAEAANAWEVVCSPQAADPDVLFSRLLRECPACQADLRLIARCGPRLSDVLRGRIEALSLLFAEEAFGLVEQFYESGAKNRGAHRLLQEAVKHMVAQFPPTHVLRILEIGAGTGGATSYLLPLLPPERTIYVFTDVSDAFLQHARQKYQDYPFLEYRLLNVEHDPHQQGYEEGSFDLIISSHVLHAASDVRQALRQLQRLLTAQGMLCLVESIECYSPFMLTVFGLLESYWLFQDTDIRLTQPLLTEQQWEHVLQSQGYTKPAVLSFQPKEVAVFLAQRRGSDHLEQHVQDEPAVRSRHWILFADEHGAAVHLQEQLRARTEHVLMVHKGTAYRRLDAQHFVVRPGHAEDMQRFLETIHAEGLPWERIVYCWGVDKVPGEMTSAALQAAVETNCGGLITLAQQLIKAGWQTLPELSVVTGGAQSPSGSDEQVAIEQAPLYGLGRVLSQEHPELRCTLMDIGLPHRQDDQYIYRREDIQALYEELQIQHEESEVLLRGPARYVNRVCRASLDPSIPAAEVATRQDMAFRLSVTTPGALSNLVLQTVSRASPQAGEVEIAVEATGLNFRDVMLSMGTINAEALEDDYFGFSLGLECAGRIASVGEGVTDFQLGDEVLALGHHSFSSFVMAEASRVVHKPGTISFEEGATIPIVFLTAWYALHHQARICQGERVLIHGAAGGVGLAAIQMVRQAGGEVFATAGNPEKRAYLRALGVQHVFDSRSLSFADDILQITQGKGVDIVLNSLTGEAATRSLELLCRFGRFVEIGKRDFLAQKKLGLSAFRRCLSYYAVDLGQLILERADLIQRAFQQLCQDFEQGTYHPLTYRVYQLSQIVDAFRSMQLSRHIGKVVVSMNPPYAPVRALLPEQTYTFQPGVSYLVTGGLSGFGLVTARWMVEHGARHLLLASRSGIPTQEAAQEIVAMRQAGAQVQLAQTDVTQEHEVAALLERIRTTLPPLGGVLHAAMVIEDLPLLELDTETLMKVVAPKMFGAWILHNQTKSLPLDFFLCYSSLASVLGNINQANYVAGNAFLDALAPYRRVQGLPALTVNWGAMAQVGYLARHTDVRTTTSRKGFSAMAPDLALRLLLPALQTDRTAVTIAEADWQRIDAVLLNSVSRTRFAQLLLSEPGEGQREHDESMASATTPDEQRAFVQARLIKILEEVLGTPAATIDPHATVDLGIDSLAAMELRNILKRDLGVDVSAVLLLQVQSIAAMAAAIVDSFTNSASLSIRKMKVFVR